ncbi:Protein SEY1-like protein 1 [Entamoeba marina]
MSQTPPSDMNISQNVNDVDDNSLQTNTETNVNDNNLNTNSIPNQSDVYMKSDSSSDTPSEVYTNEHEITPQLTPEIKSEEEQEIHNDGPLLSVKPLNETTDVIPTDSFPLKKSNENNIQEIDNEIVEILEEIEVPPSKTIPCLQIIDQDGLFADEEQSNEQSFEEFLKDIPSFTKLGFNYNMLSILGPQNSGKSTLLNYLFDTDFAVLDQTLKRQRTTRGVWLGVVGKRQDVLIMDLEGSDGSAREDDYSFERKISLFSLSVCSVLMVNIWSHDVGRYGASNMSLLKNDSPRTLILFVIRDRDQRKPFSSTRDALLEDIMKIWDTVARPDCFKRAPIGKFFDLEFTSLPHFKHDKEQFIKEAKELKKRFDSQNPDTYFRDIYNKEIPADGLSIFTKQVWGTIKTRYRCDEIIETIYEEYEMEASAVKYAHAEMKQFDNFKEFVDTLFDEKMKQFMTIASKYLDRVVKEKSEVLSEKMLNDISYMFQTQTNIIINHIKKMLTTKYSTLKAQYIQEQSKDFDPSTYESYAEQMDEFNSNIVDEWKKISTENVPNNVENTFGVGIDALGRFIHKLYEIGRRDLIDALMTHFKKHLQKIMKPVLYPIFEKTEKDMWEQVRNVVKETTSNNLEKLKNGMINSLKMDNTEVELKLEELNSYITDAVRLTILERPSFVNIKWKANDDLSKPYFHASEEAEKILDLFSYIRIDPKDDEMSFTSINPATGKKMLIEEPEDALIIPEKFYLH